MARKSDDNEDTVESCFAISDVRIHAMELHALMDIGGAALNFLFLRVVKNLSLERENTTRVVTVATGDKSDAVQNLTGGPVLSNELHAEVNFIDLRNVSFDVVIGSPTIMRLGVVCDFPAELVRFDYRGQQTNLPVMSKYTQSYNMPRAIYSRYLRSESEVENSIHAGEEGNEDDNVENLLLISEDQLSAVASLRKRYGVEGDDLRLGEKLAHLKTDVFERIGSMLREAKVIASFLHDLGPSDVPVRHSSDPMDEKASYRAPRLNGSETQ